MVKKHKGHSDSLVQERAEQVLSTYGMSWSPNVLYYANPLTRPNFKSCRCSIIVSLPGAFTRIQTEALFSQNLGIFFGNFQQIFFWRVHFHCKFKIVSLGGYLHPMIHSIAPAYCLVGCMLSKLRVEIDHTCNVHGYNDASLFKLNYQTIAQSM
jgi:hypothetical protein